MVMRILIIIAIITLSCTAQDIPIPEVPGIIAPPLVEGIGPDQPVVFPELTRATITLEGGQFYEEFNQSAWDEAWNLEWAALLNGTNLTEAF